MNKVKTAGARIFLLSLALLPHAVVGQAPKAKLIDAYVNQLAEVNLFSGVVLASEDGKVIYEKAFGLANAEYKIPNQLNTRIGIASITKLMTIVILNRLLEEKRIALDDKLNKYIRDFPSGDKITIQMLRSHRSGILHRVMPPEQEAVAYTSEEFIEKVKQAKLAFEPGTQRLYSSGGYAVLARTLEIASGKPYAKLLQEYVFTPADMKDSLDFKGEMIMERRAQDYLVDHSGYINAPLKDYSFLVGAGSVFSTARDVYKFGEAVLDGKFGTQSKTDLLGQTTLSGSGSTNGHRSYIEIERNKKYGYVLVSNLGSGGFDIVSRGLGEILQGKEVSVKTVPKPKIISTPKNLAEFPGRYVREGGGGSVEMVVKNETLYAGDIRLYPTGIDRFFEYRFFGDVIFVRDSAGKVKQAEWASPGITSVWVKQ